MGLKGTRDVCGYSYQMKTILIRTGLSILAGLIVAVFMTVVGIGGSLTENLIGGTSVGLLIPLIRHALMVFVSDPAKRIFAYTAALLLGTLGGIGILFLWINPAHIQAVQHIALITLAVCVVIGGPITALFYLQARKAELEKKLHAAELQKIEAERRGLEAQLKMLQAQIEPHFLFNTLANVIALIETNPPLARRLLEHLNVYLRATLARTRSEQATLGEEMDLLRAYLDICRIRMGERLRYVFDVPENLSSRPFPPMLLQPLVENAIKHGLEPNPSAGEVRITARNDQGRLHISIVDNGIGFGDAPGNGTGMTNVRARLAALYGDASRLMLEENPTGGVRARLELPL